MDGELMGKISTTKANNFLEELKTIPHLIETLERDANLMSRSLVKSPQWSDMRVSGGVKQSQEDKNIKALDMISYYSDQIERLKKRKEEMADIIIQNTSICESHVLLTTYLHCRDYDEAMERLNIGNRNKYFRFIRKGKESLELILK